jgi:hypothetical protein
MILLELGPSCGGDSAPGVEGVEVLLDRGMAAAVGELELVPFPLVLARGSSTMTRRIRRTVSYQTSPAGSSVIGGSSNL